MIFWQQDIVYFRSETNTTKIILKLKLFSETANSLSV